LFNRFVGIARIYVGDAARKMPDCVTLRQVGHVFAGVTWAGALSRRRYGRKVKSENPTPERAGGEPRPLRRL